MSLKAHPRLYPQQLATIRRVKSKALRGTLPTAATTQSPGSSGPCSNPATSCLALAGIRLAVGISSVSSSPEMKPSGLSSCFLSPSRAKFIQLLVRLSPFRGCNTHMKKLQGEQAVSSQSQHPLGQQRLAGWWPRPGQLKQAELESSKSPFSCCISSKTAMGLSL